MEICRTLVAIHGRRRIRNDGNDASRLKVLLARAICFRPFFCTYIRLASSAISFTLSYAARSCIVRETYNFRLPVSLREVRLTIITTPSHFMYFRSWLGLQPKRIPEPVVPSYRHAETRCISTPSSSIPRLTLTVLAS